MADGIIFHQAITKPDLRLHKEGRLDDGNYQKHHTTLDVS